MESGCWSAVAIRSLVASSPWIRISRSTTPAECSHVQGSQLMTFLKCEYNDLKVKGFGSFNGNLVNWVYLIKKQVYIKKNRKGKH